MGDDFSEDELMLFLQKLEKEKKLNQFFKIMKVIVDDKKDVDYEFNELRRVKTSINRE
jgi:hypothetical protein